MVERDVTTLNRLRFAASIEIYRARSTDSSTCRSDFVMELARRCYEMLMGIHLPLIRIYVHLVSEAEMRIIIL